MRQAVRDLLPSGLELESSLRGKTDTWSVRRDLLLDSHAGDKHFVVEVEADDAATVRFGDDHFGERPEPTTEFTATYRIGNGVGGNIGADALAHIVTDLPVTRVRNPLPARGGVEPESVDDVRARAPAAFRTQERAVTREDYAAITQRRSDVQRAAATFRWTGSWHTVFLTVDRLGGLAVDDPFRADVRRHVERYRMAGYDLEVDRPRFVSLEIAMHVCAKPDYFRSDVKAALLEVFSRRDRPGGRRGLFHPDEFTFGQTVYLSRLYAAAQAVPGVASVHITKFQRQGQTGPSAPPSLSEGKIALGRLEVARLDNDPNFPEHGVFHLDVGGGK
jgi:predicted phage baseplate assembly protein